MSPSLIRNGGTITGYACNGKDPPPLFVEPHHLRYYSVDASGYCVKPSAVAFPGTAEDVAGLVRRAISRGTSVTARGGGTGLVGGSLNRGIILDMSGFRKVRINEDTADAGPGVPRGMLDEMLEGSSRFFAPNPSVGRYCTIGGMVATNASGSRSLKYGSTLDNLEEVTLVDGRGDIITLPQNKDYSVQVARICGKADLESYPATTKNSCGYRLDAVPTAAESHRVVAASEGTLGVIISARLRTFPEPRERRLVVIGYDSELEAAEDCAGIVRHRPSALEVVGPDVLECAMTPAICLLLAEFDTPADDWEGGLRNTISGKILDNATGSAAGRWWRRRDTSLAASLRLTKNALTPSIIEDAAVPLARLPDLFEALAELRRNTGGRVFYYGHAGNGNIHVRTATETGSDAEWYLDTVMDMGGTITGEHGDGIARTRFVKRQYGEKNHALFADLKRLFDPHNVLNPGKIVAEWPDGECG